MVNRTLKTNFNRQYSNKTAEILYIEFNVHNNMHLLKSNRSLSSYYKRNINWRDVQRKWRGTMTKRPVQKPTHRTTQTHVFIYNFLNDFSKKCWVTALVLSMTFIGGLNQFSAITNLTSHTTDLFLCVVFSLNCYQKC